MLGPMGMGGGRWGLEPWDYLAYALFAGVVYALVGWRWWLAPLFVAALLLWPYAVRFARAAMRRAAVGARSSGVGRRPGVLYCAECGAPLAAAGPAAGFTVQECADCGGKWGSAKDLAAGLIKKSRRAAEWLAYEGKPAEIRKPCPACAGPMTAGSFRGGRGTAFRCAACDGYWHDRIDWVSFELG